MSPSAPPAAGRGTFPRGVHPEDRKALSADAAIEVLPVPPEVRIPLVQHIGAPCEPAVKPRQEVALGDVVGTAPKPVSAAVHASIAGTCQLPSVATLPNGRHVRTIPIQAADEQIEPDALYADVLGGDWPVDDLEAHDSESILQAVRDAGLVGLGGAAFPTAVKLTPNPDKPVDTLLVNGCECEPYLTADYRLMLEAPSAVVAGALLAARACGAERMLAVIEDNKPAALTAMREAAEGTALEVRSLKTKYPMGGERQAVYAALRREVPTGGLPLDVAVVVQNVGTCAAVARAVLRGKPLTHRVLSVTGAGIAQPKNLLVPIGVPYRALLEYCGGVTADAARVVAGGPMMGFTLGNWDTPVTKGTSGVTVLTREDVRKADETACVRCGRCVDVCPLHLVPTKMALAARHGDWEQARRHHLTACCECGCCAYVCPASLPLVQLIRMGKAMMPRE